jgi:hypothetical protein
MARDCGQVNRTLLRLKLPDGPVPQSSPLFREGKEVGRGNGTGWRSPQCRFLVKKRAVGCSLTGRPVPFVLPSPPRHGPAGRALWTAFLAI